MNIEPNNQSFLNIFKANGGWCVVVPYQYVEDEKDTIERVKRINSLFSEEKDNDVLYNDPLLKRLMGEEKKEKKSSKNTMKMVASSLVNDELYIFPRLSNAILFIAMIYNEDGTANELFSLEKSYLSALKTNKE